MVVRTHGCKNFLVHQSELKLERIRISYVSYNILYIFIPSPGKSKNKYKNIKKAYAERRLLHLTAERCKKHGTAERITAALSGAESGAISKPGNEAS